MMHWEVKTTKEKQGSERRGKAGRRGGRRRGKKEGEEGGGGEGRRERRERRKEKEEGGKKREGGSAVEVGALNGERQTAGPIVDLNDSPLLIATCAEIPLEVALGHRC